MDDKVRVTDGFVFFWGGWPSQWHKSRFVIDGVQYNCAEQFMMAEKARVFGDGAATAEILASSNPREQKAIGRRVRGFDESTWNSVCRGIVCRANLAKYEQNAELCTILLATENRVIVEASPKDRVWGIGLSQSDPRALHPAQWLGTNWLGIAIMQARDEIRRRRGHPAPAFDAELRRQLDTRAAITREEKNP
ncbi:MAG: NADAR family protein [Tepidisphaeraceae bacterium]